MGGREGGRAVDEEEEFLWRSEDGNAEQATRHKHHPATMERRSECFAVVLSCTIFDLSTTLTTTHPVPTQSIPARPRTVSRVHHTAVLAENAVHGAWLDNVKVVARPH
jgi:hypothetical protein